MSSRDGDGDQAAGPSVAGVRVELLACGQMEVRAELLDGSILHLIRTDGDLAMLMKRLVDGFPDDRETLSLYFLSGQFRFSPFVHNKSEKVQTADIMDVKKACGETFPGLLRIRAAEQTSLPEVKNVEVNKLLNKIIKLPPKVRRMESTDFFLINQNTGLTSGSILLCLRFVNVIVAVIPQEEVRVHTFIVCVLFMCVCIVYYYVTVFSVRSGVSVL